MHPWLSAYLNFSSSVMINSSHWLLLEVQLFLEVLFFAAVFASKFLKVFSMSIIHFNIVCPIFPIKINLIPQINTIASSLLTKPKSNYRKMQEDWFSLLYNGISSRHYRVKFHSLIINH